MAGGGFRETTSLPGAAPDYVPAPASVPTQAAPGSRAKTETLASRYLAGEHLYHPDDQKTAAPLATARPSSCGYQRSVTVYSSDFLDSCD